MALLLLAALPALGSIRNNDTTCDIGVLPAATLLLPFFEVDLAAGPGAGETTLFTITNTSNLPQIAHVVLWTDAAFPVIDFNLYLTGYNVQSINLYDVIVRGRIAPDNGTGSALSRRGDLSASDHPHLDEASCAAAAPVQLTQPFVTRMQQAFTLGRVPAQGTLPACINIGTPHVNAVGYATVDIVGACETATPLDASYFSSLIRFDNVLMGDYQQVDGSENFAQGNPMVHIRAIPEGGTPQSRAATPSKYATNFTRTFYSRYQPEATRTADARQPLPTLLAARWISAGHTDYQTSFKVWREGRPGAGCSDYARNIGMTIVEMVRFNEEEAPTAAASFDWNFEPGPILSAVSRIDVADASVFPPALAGDIAGWMYLNLDRISADGLAPQAWVTASMRSEKRYSVDLDALAFGNGCTPETPPSNALVPGGAPLGPAANVNP